MEGEKKTKVYDEVGENPGGQGENNGKYVEKE